jgi:hypothetical protein
MWEEEDRDLNRAVGVPRYQGPAHSPLYPHRFSHSAYSFKLKTEAARSSKTLVKVYQTAQNYAAEEHNS